MKMGLDDICDTLEFYSPRERTLRLLQYGSLLISGSTMVSHKQRTGLLQLYRGLSETRTILRFFDGLPMLRETLDYGFGNDKESDATLRLLGWLTNLSDLFYYPFEHIYWLLDRRILLTPGPESSLSGIPWGDLSNLCWALALLGRVLKSLRYLELLSETAKNWENDNGQCFGISNPSKCGDFDERRTFHAMTLVQASADLIMAIHYMPEGVWGAGRLKMWQIGLCGSISSVLGIYKTTLCS